MFKGTTLGFHPQFSSLLGDHKSLEFSEPQFSVQNGNVPLLAGRYIQVLSRQQLKLSQIGTT